ncbi:hypothetical protein M413DRAFT_450158 [Hebeloma cylindrosporum]|uniref:Uncharacterized protein n=1 Tax=Hebeloma cylindrosporum TaxID=76867 RepID=A0A0C2Y0J2_HEBCY|nr:hypothetical protein M413DRAFT_450158 [Hebeloma cylindrosporum h7]
MRDRESLGERPSVVAHASGKMELVAVSTMGIGGYEGDITLTNRRLCVSGFG